MTDRALFQRLIKHRSAQAIGFFPDSVANLHDAHMRDVIRDQVAEMPGMILNEDGSAWRPQNPDGSFPALPGFDGPIV